jgi:hypothetical protein
MERERERERGRERAKDIRTYLLYSRLSGERGRPALY